MRRLTLADPPSHVPLEEAGIDSSRPTLLLLNASERAGVLGAMLEFFERLESVSHTLVWCEEGEAALRLARVELPRLRLSFEARASSHEFDGGAVAKGGPLLYCLEEPGFFVSNRRDASELMRGLPQSALLENAMGEQLVLLPATAAPLPSAHGCVPTLEVRPCPSPSTWRRRPRGYSVVHTAPGLTWAAGSSSRCACRTRRSPCARR